MHSDTNGPRLGVDSHYVELAAEVFSLLSDATRVGIVLALGEGELSVNQLAELVGKSPSAVSQHLAKLRLGRIVTARHEANRVFYSVSSDHARRLVADAVHQAEHAVDSEPSHHRAGVDLSESDRPGHASR
jgi:DNA-binding transcriptional ArsR family regulator